jgi:chromate transporter
VAGLLYGIKPAVAAIVLHALHRIASKSLGAPRQWPVPWAIALASFAGLAVFDVPFPAVVLGALALGWLLSRHGPHLLRTGAGHASAAQESGGALIDDHTPAPAHARFSRRQLARVLLVGALLWALPMAALLAAYGWGTLAQMGAFFSKAALLTFGGAYAVLPYVQQAAVEQHGWLSTAQMMDGLALGETTPGPLIMVVTFVGFVGGWIKQVLGPDLLLPGAVLAACVATWFTFLPSFVFILAGGPWVESTRGQPRLSLPLAAVTCAVVGVIANLGLWFLGAVVFPSGITVPPDLWAAALVLACGWALWRWKWSVMRVIAAAALLGLLLRATGLA